MNHLPSGKESGAAIQPGFWLRTALIIGAAFWAFSPAIHGGWLWDDDILLTQNALILDPAGLWKVWFQPSRLVDYYPLTYTVEWFEWRLWRNVTFGYHVTNIVLHLVASLLIWRLFHRLGLTWAWLGGLIFAIHPVNVESVAWIAEIKNTLSLPPFLLAIGAYLDFDERGKSRDYFRALLLFLIAMLCKSSMVMFPVIILLYAWWKRSRITRVDLSSSAPFFAISLVLGLITLTYARGNVDTADIPMGSTVARLAAAGLASAFYFSKCVLPIGLMPIYPRWIVDPPSPIQFLPYLILLGVFLVCWTRRDSWGRHALLGLGFFLIMLAPLVAIIGMGYTWAMDHLVYIPLIGLVGLAVAGLENLHELLPKSARPFLLGIAAAAMVFLGCQTHSYAAIFRSSEALWTYAVNRNAQAWTAHADLGAALYLKGDYEGAIAQDNQSLQIHPAPDTYNNLGLALIESDHLPEAISAFESSLRINSRYSPTRDHLGFALMAAGRESEAKQQFEAALQIDPHDEYAQRFLHQIESSDQTVPSEK